MMIWMDLLFKDYASPFVLLDEVIGSGRFVEFIHTFAKQRRERLRWEYYISKMPAWDDTSWAEFNRILDKEDEPEATEEELEATVSDSYNILTNFNPDERG